jgi:hypothetical protein
MARDFIIAAESHGSDWARDLLAGYVRTSWLLTDEVYPGYTDALIGVLGGRLASASRSAGPVLSSTLLTECLGDAIRVMPDGVRLHALPGPMPVEQLARLIGGLIVSGISCRPLIEPLAAAGPTHRYVASCLTRIYQPGQAAREEPHQTLGNDIVGLFDFLASRSDLAQEETWPATPLYPALKHIASGDEPGIRSLLAAVSDVSDWLAVRTDSGTHDENPLFVSSVRFAQLSLVLMQLEHWPIRELEACELTVTARHRHLTWYPKLFSAAPGDPEFPQLFTYIRSKHTLASQMYKLSDKRLVTGHWRALAWARGVLLTVLRSLPDQVTQEEAEFRYEILKMCTGQLFRTIGDTLVSQWAPDILLQYSEDNEDGLMARTRLLTDFGDLLKAGTGAATMARHPTTERLILDLAGTNSWNFDHFIACRVPWLEPLPDN